MSASGPAETAAYYATRYARDPNRSAVWRHITEFLHTWIPAESDVLELGAGYCDFSNALCARSRTAMDIGETVKQAAAPGVLAEVGDCTDLRRFSDLSFDVVFASNLVEHLSRQEGQRLVEESLRVLKPGGRLILMQPNFRLRPAEYFDDYTHVTVYSDRSLPDFLAAMGYEIVKVLPRFLPQSMKSRFSALSVLVPLYLRSPIKPMAGQMLVVARRPV
jgi:SAM-dependent methyltransferase